MPYCQTNKIAYIDRAAAKSEMKHLRQIRVASARKTKSRSHAKHLNDAPLWCRAYECPFCGGWHLTSKEYDDERHTA